MYGGGSFGPSWLTSANLWERMASVGEDLWERVGEDGESVGEDGIQAFAPPGWIVVPRAWSLRSCLSWAKACCRSVCLSLSRVAVILLHCLAVVPCLGDRLRELPPALLLGVKEGSRLHSQWECTPSPVHPIPLEVQQVLERVRTYQPSALLVPFDAVAAEDSSTEASYNQKQGACTFIKVCAQGWLGLWGTKLINIRVYMVWYPFRHHPFCGTYPFRHPFAS